MIETNCLEIVTETPRGAVSISLQECSQQLSKVAVRSGIESLQAAPSLTTTLNRRMSQIDTKLVILQRNIDRSHDLAVYFESAGP